MSVILVIISLTLAVFLAYIRVQSVEDIYKKTVLMSELAEALEKNYLQDLESVYSICSDFFGCEISNGDRFLLESILKEKLGSKNESFFEAVLSLSSACGTEIADIISNIKETSKASMEQALSELNGIKSSAYVLYPGIVFILALLTL